MRSTYSHYVLITITCNTAYRTFIHHDMQVNYFDHERTLVRFYACVMSCQGSIASRARSRQGRGRAQSSITSFGISVWYTSGALSPF